MKDSAGGEYHGRGRIKLSDIPFNRTRLESSMRSMGSASTLRQKAFTMGAADESATELLMEFWIILI